MKAIVLMFDSLNRHYLPPYGCDWTHAPNFARLAQRTVTFDKSYVCSMPCMPARRELHTARPNFLHRAWGPLEPFDDSIFEILKTKGVYSHLVTDHYHYFEDGGGTYHTRYNTWEFERGREGDPWIGQVTPPLPPENINESRRMQDWVNRQFMSTEATHSQTRCFDRGLEFLRRNKDADNWVLQLETFDPHEPFFACDRFKKLYPHDYTGPVFDWPNYGPVTETPEQVKHCRLEYAALLSQCDHSLGRVLDLMDEQDMWKDTLLIVWTDHGFHLGERNVWAKIVMGWYEQTAHTPFFVWDPRCGCKNERRQALVQPAIDIGPTLLDFFSAAPTQDMLGQSLRHAISSDEPVREAAIFGMHGLDVNVTDGRYVYMRQPAVAGVQNYNYTLMPTHMRERFPTNALAKATLHEGFAFTKGCPVLKIPARLSEVTRPHVLYDLVTDPEQNNPMNDPAIERRMIEHMTKLMRRCEAPAEHFIRLGFPTTAG